MPQGFSSKRAPRTRSSSLKDGAGKRARQLTLISSWQRERFAFGGSLLKSSHAKSKRPFSKKLSVHVVLRSSKAVGALSLLRQARRVEAVLFEESKKHHVRLQGAANSGNHLHLLVKAPSREHLSNFLRAVSGRIAMIVTGARKGVPLGLEASRETGAKQEHAVPSRAGTAAEHASQAKAARSQGQAQETSLTHGKATRLSSGFWDQRPFTRLVSEGKETLQVLRYLTLNSTEVGAKLSREAVRRMFQEIGELLKAGRLARAPGLVAAGFV